MKYQQLLIRVALAGVALVASAILIGMVPVGSTRPPVLRGSGLELVDDGGRLRARINVESDGAVVFRLLDQSGAIRVKLGADAGGSGLVLLREGSEVGVQILAKEGTGTVRLGGKDRKEMILKP